MCLNFKHLRLIHVIAENSWQKLVKDRPMEWQTDVVTDGQTDKQMYKSKTVYPPLPRNENIKAVEHGIKISRSSKQVITHYMLTNNNKKKQIWVPALELFLVLHNALQDKICISQMTSLGKVLFECTYSYILWHYAAVILNAFIGATVTVISFLTIVFFMTKSLKGLMVIWVAYM